MKKYKDFGVYDFSDYAEEITGDALFKINGGAEAMSPADQADMAAALRNGDTETAASIMSKYQNTETPTPPATYGNTPDSTSGVDTGNGNSEISNNNSTNTTTENHTTISINLPTIPENIRNNPHALAYYMSKQGQAKEEGEPDRYKGYNVLGAGIKTKELKADSMNNETNVNYNKNINSTNSYKFDFWKELEDCLDLKIGLRADFQVKIRNNINVGGSINIASIDTEYETGFYTSGLEGFLAIGNDTVNLIELGGKFEKTAFGSCAFALLEYGTEYEFTPYANYNTKGDISFTAGIGFVATFHINEILDLGLKSMRSMGFE